MMPTNLIALGPQGVPELGKRGRVRVTCGVLGKATRKRGHLLGCLWEKQQSESERGRSQARNRTKGRKGDDIDGTTES